MEMDSIRGHLKKAWSLAKPHVIQMIHNMTADATGGGGKAR
jgi:hypothetical protein